LELQTIFFNFNLKVFPIDLMKFCDKINSLNMAGCQ
jgi:hypothetical protein